jgi:hypothetical protein
MSSDGEAAVADPQRDAWRFLRTAGEDALPGHLEQARAVLAGPTGSTTARPARPTTSSGCAGSTCHRRA